MANEQKPPRAYAAPLEGAVGREIAQVLCAAFSLITLGMLGKMAMKPGLKTGGPSLFTGAHHAIGANHAASGVRPPEMHAKLPTPKPPTVH